MRWPGPAVFLVALAILCAGCDMRAGNLSGRVIELGGDGLTTATRLSAAGTYPVCRRPGLDPMAGCDVDPPRIVSAVADLVRDVRRAAREAGSVDALHARALIDLIWARDEAAVDRSIENLESLISAADSTAILNALTVAWERKARFSGQVADWVCALDYAERAFAARRTPTTLLNRAVLLDRFRLSSRAVLAWKAVIEEPSAGAWHAEAAARSAALSTGNRAGMVEEMLEAALERAEPGSLAEAASVAHDHPQIGRRFATLRVLPFWSEARRTGDGAAVEHAIELVDSIGGGIARRSGDLSLREEAERLRSEAVTDRAAEAYETYAAAELAFTTARYDEMAVHARRVVERAASPASVVAPWARYLVGIVAFQARDYGSADSIFVTILEEPRYADRHSLLGRAYWGRGLIAAREYRGATALAFYARAEEELRQSAEAEYTAALLQLVVEQKARSGDMHDAWNTLAGAIEALTDHRSSQYLTESLRRAADMAAGQGRLHAALAFQREGLAIAEAGPSAQKPIEARTNLGLLLARLGRGMEAEENWREAESGLPAISDEAMLARLTADLQSNRLVSALLPGLSGGGASADSLEKLVQFYDGGAFRSRTASLRHELAEAYVAQGDTTAAVRQLEQAGSLIVDALRDLGAPQRLPLASAGRTVERLAQMYASAGRAERSLAVSDLARAVQIGSYDLASLLDAEIPEDRVVLALSALPDELLVWRIDAGRVTLDRRPVRRSQLADSIAAFSRHLRNGVAPGLSAAGLWLGRTLFPDPAWLPTELAIVADGTLVRLPFVAVPLDADGSIVLDSTAIRIVPSIRHLDDGKAAHDGRVQKSVVLAGSEDPVLRLPELPFARAEVRAIAALRQGATALESGTDSRALVNALSNANIFHFAGHAVLGDSPLDSRLVLAAIGSESARYFDVAALSEADFSALETVILSSCRTLDPGAETGSGLPAFAAAFLSAGASSVVGTLWPIDDEATVGLMVSLHRHLMAGRPVHIALALAQREARVAGATVTPDVWAAFEVVTR